MIYDLFAGPGGWDVGLAYLRPDLDVVGIEYDAAACATRAAAGLRTVRADVRTLRPPSSFFGLIASPPCPEFSQAGKGEARDEIDGICAAARAGDWSRPFATEGARLVLEPLRWIIAGAPRWVALEQVPPVLPIWEAYRTYLDRLGYSTWCGILNAADYGVPQTRRRAILLASLERTVGPPAATHDQSPMPSLFGPELARWVSMAEALGWGMSAAPYPTIASGRSTGGPDREKVGGSGAREFLYGEQVAGRWVVATRGVDRPETRSGDSFDGAEGPSRAMTAKSYSWVVQTGNNSHVTSRVGSRAGEGGVELYERPVSEPAPTVDGKVGGAWRVVTDNQTGSKAAGYPPGERPSSDELRYERDVAEPAPTLSTRSDQWKIVGINTGRDWKPGGTRADAQTIPPDQPAPAIDGRGRWHALVEEGVWNEDRPATTLAADPRVFAPGSHAANDGRDLERAVGRSEKTIRLEIGDALVLQSFPRDYPVAGSKTKQFEQVGNAVPPVLAREILRKVLK